ncbi:MAG: helix-turn-helix transcriptional regulator [Lewinellaceae bacterium]|nr:helix-turn-helix transcriptional regulator [Saprospiraceae bacterium]MCB9315458.1 helix-turn-helix transcriptional regulator [Lewinellaceae bacterium]MCB9331136.1 helix-turn-helix transcriptional regulator [Lewinellaceae bacterium]
MYSWHDIILLIGFAQGLFIAFVLWHKPATNWRARNYLVGIVGGLALIMLMRAGFQPEMVRRFAAVLLLPDVILFTQGPLLYLFTRALLNRSELSLQGKLLHFSPAILHVLVLNTIIGQHLVGKLHFLTKQQILYCFFAIELGAIISLFCYLMLSYRAFLRYRHNWTIQYTTPFPARFFATFFPAGFVVCLIWAVSFGLNVVQPEPDYAFYNLMWLILAGYVFVLGYQLVLHPELLELPRVRTVLPNEELKLLTLERHMQEVKPFLDEQLKLADLALAVDLSPHELSRLLNHSREQGFFEYVNAYRIRHFIALRNDPACAERNISELAYQSGFNSRTAFNRAFRKVTGMSPSVYFR